MFFILIVYALRIVVIKTTTVQNEFKMLKNEDVNSTVAETYNNLTLKLNKPVEMLCIASCNSNQECASVVYDRRSRLIQNCFLYRRYFNSSERIPSSTSTMHVKKQTTALSTTSTTSTTTVTKFGAVRPVRPV
jgi:hypothetical protein